MPLRMDEIETALSDCTHFAYIGTSSQVYPAAGFRHTAKARGAKVLCINLEVEPDPGTDLFLRGEAGTEVPRWAEGFSRTVATRGGPRSARPWFPGLGGGPEDRN
jgi:NAD-dependent deacetylase